MNIELKEYDGKFETHITCDKHFKALELYDIAVGLGFTCYPGRKTLCLFQMKTFNAVTTDQAQQVLLRLSI